MKIGIVGLPNVGKSTLFNSITNAGAECANYPFCTIEPNVGMVAVPDDRLDNLSKLYDTEKQINAVVEFVDIAGLVKGASKGEGLGNKFLSHIRETDAIIQVVRCFEDTNIVHVETNVSPRRDTDTINLELILADLESLNKRHERIAKLSKNDKKYLPELELIEKIRTVLENGKPARSIEFTDEENILVKEFFLITTKPILYIANISENDITNPENEYVKELREIAKSENAGIEVLSAKVEEELSKLDDSEKAEMLGIYGIERSGLDVVIKASYDLLGLMSYLTAGKKECRAWTIKKGTKAPKAAGKIHTDFERGFIKAEIISYDDLMKAGNMVKAKELGLVRLEGKEYIMKDGDIVEFKFNV